MAKTIFQDVSPAFRNFGSRNAKPVAPPRNSDGRTAAQTLTSLANASKTPKAKTSRTRKPAGATSGMVKQVQTLERNSSLY